MTDVYLDMEQAYHPLEEEVRMPLTFRLAAV